MPTEITEKSFKFFTDNFGWTEIKSESGSKYYITGYISTKDLDTYGDIVTEECLDDMIVQLKTKNIKLDVEHEVFRDNPNIIPVGRILEAHKDSKGIWIKAELNSSSPKFNSVFGSIKEKFIDAFSIAFKAIDVVRKGTTRFLKKIDLLNVALTGNPVNSACSIGAVFTKSLNDFEENIGDNMTEVKDEAVEETVEEPTVEVAAEAKVEAETPAVEEKDNSEITELKAKLDELTAELKAIKVELNKPVLKAKLEEMPMVEQKSDKIRGPMDMIR